MNTPYKMKGSPMQRNFGLPSPAKHEGYSMHNHAEGGSGSYKKNANGGVGDQSGTGTDDGSTTEAGDGGEQMANMFNKLGKQQADKSAQMANTPIDYDPHRRDS